MKKVFKPLIFTLLIFPLLFSGCSSSVSPTPPSPTTSSPTSPPFSAVDFWGNYVQLPLKPSRIVSLGPSATEIVASLGALDRLVGVTTADDFPPEVSNIEKVGGMDNPSLEKILSLQPDLVLAVFGNPLSLVEILKSQKIPVFGLNPETVEEVIEDIFKVGNLIGEEENAKKLASDIQGTIDLLNSKKSRTNTIPKVYIETWPQEPYYTFGAGTFGDDIINLAGGENIASGIDEPYPALSTDYILFENPDCIVLAYMVDDPNKSLKSRKGWENVSAVIQGRILVPNDPNVFLRPGPRVKEALLELARFLHPEWFEITP
ncbi:MAG: helical backbone metal receptor [Caldiserica bacterium]|jgi:iron complex transport system substrate-binding protein|nr:helical backbone metal receptor [Caldisericota bacterium]MDH7562695.1 helical backbone metal receptor [Caldisericota bacterium]